MGQRFLVLLYYREGQETKQESKNSSGNFGGTNGLPVCKSSVSGQQRVRVGVGVGVEPRCARTVRLLALHGKTWDTHVVEYHPPITNHNHAVAVAVVVSVVSSIFRSEAPRGL